ncbi:hypothetical protein I2I05_12970 [Hymenobacter sp. BT683]|uniref:Uncharacterized protein n=1 Tax=Hymenobacter jeongseonensis TaxID=2791027 RepID=A0ABS0IKM2_9BACT|nr:hypothetical protein [Hymenobacter jeongseonensis]MBF9238310.1 hypothetical protein [Hymenobacter jeongseonensis]
MKRPYTAFGFLIISFSAFGQSKTDKLTQPIVAQGKRLYQSEMASWYGTDIFLEHHKNRADIGGYFSYPTKSGATCIFFSKATAPVVIGTIAFDSTYNVKTAQVWLKERVFTTEEANLFAIRDNALKTIEGDTLFKTYKNTNLNIIPLITGREKTVYVLTGPKQNGVVIFGNDYLLTFDDSNRLVSKRALHKNIISIEFGPKAAEGKEVEGAMHSHLPETGDFITATDICTLMLYEKMTQWKQHTVVSSAYVSIWNCQKDELVVLTRKAIERINKDQEKRHPKQ